MTTAWCSQLECVDGSAHHHCALCGIPNPGDTLLCPQHSAYADEWATGNRLFCHGLHRHAWPEGLPADVRHDDVVTLGGDVDG